MGSSKKSQPTPPPAPNPAEIIDAQAQANRINQDTPFGSLLFSGPNNNTATLTLDPALQGVVDNQLQLDQALTGQALQGVNTLPRGPAFNGFGIPGQPGTSQPIPGIQTLAPGALPGVPDLSTPGVAAPGGVDLETTLQGLGPLSTPDLASSIPGLDLSGATELPGDLGAFRSEQERAFFDRASGILGEQFGRDEDQLRQRLADQGLQVGGEAFGQELGLFNQRRGETFENLARDAVRFGGQETSRALSDALASRGQGVNESLASFNAGLTQGQFGNQANLAGTDIANQNALQQFQAALAGGQFANQGELAGFDVEQQIRNANLQNQLLGNDAATQQFGLGTQAAQNELARLGTNNAARTQLFNETAAARGTQFNELASRLGLQQTAVPQLQNFFGPGQINAVDPFALQAQGLQSNFNTQANNSAAKKGSMADLGATLGAAGIAASDRRLKDNIVQIGVYRDTPIYCFTWNTRAEKLGLHGASIGVMADEVDPRYVTERDGYLAVDYGALTHA